MGCGDPRRMSAASTSLACMETAALMRLTRKPTPVRAATATVNASSRTPSSPERHSRASVRKASARTTRENERHANPPAPGFWVSLVFAGPGRARMTVLDDPSRFHRDYAAAARGERAVVRHQNELRVRIRVQVEQQL